MTEGANSETPITPAKISRRDFLKGVGNAGAALIVGDLIRKTGVDIPQGQTVTEEMAKRGQGMALALLNQVKNLEPEVAQLVENAYDHTSRITLARDQNYSEALETFERIADSLLKFGAVRTLNRILDNQKITYSWKDIREVIDEVIMTPGQPLSEFSNYFAKRKPIDPKESRIQRYFWRGLPKEGKVVPVYDQPTYLDNIDAVHYMIGSFSQENPEAIMGAFLATPPEKPSMDEKTAPEYRKHMNYLYDWVVVPIESLKGCKLNTDFFEWLKNIFDQERRNVVYIRASEITPTYT